MKRKKPREKVPHRDAPWTPFVRCNTLLDGNGHSVPLPPGVTYWRNNQYQADLHEMAAMPPWGRVVWLSIKRNDRQPIHDWRDLQRIKNELLGRNVEAVELYPSEDRHVDTSNQYHLWAFVDGWRFPYGYTERLLMDPDYRSEAPPLLSGSRQRPYRRHERPSDVLTVGEALERYRSDPQFGERITGRKEE